MCIRDSSKVMGEFAKEYDPENVDFWRTVGMLHDIDFELYPEQHCVKAIELLHENDIDEDVIHAVISHGYGICIDVVRRGCAHAPDRT